MHVVKSGEFVLFKFTKTQDNTRLGEIIRQIDFSGKLMTTPLKNKKWKWKLI